MGGSASAYLSLERITCAIWGVMKKALNSARLRHPRFLPWRCKKEPHGVLHPLHPLGQNLLPKPVPSSFHPATDAIQDTGR